MSEIDRLPPQNMELEKEVLGAMMSESPALERGLELLSENMFYNNIHRLVFQAMKDLTEDNKPVDIISLGEQLEKMGKMEKIGGMSYLSSMLSSVVTSANLDYHIGIIREKFIRRSIIESGSQMVSKAYDEGMEVSLLLDSVEKEIFDISEQRLKGDFESVENLLPATYEKLEEIRHQKRSVTGLPTGFVELDRLTSGLHESDYVIIAARPSIGKTALALSMASNVATKEKKGVAIFSLEMAKEQLVVRLMSSKFKVDAQKLRNGTLKMKEFKKIAHNLRTLSSAPIYIDDSPSQTVLDMRAKTRRLFRRHEIGLIIVDYLQLITTNGRSESRQQEITTISRQLKALARELKVPLIALSQLSRQVESRESKRPILADLRESGALEQDADVVMFIYRAEVYKKKKVLIDDIEYPSDGIAEVIIAKQRNGPVGSRHLSFKKNYVSFENLDLSSIEPFDVDYDPQMDTTNYGGA